MQCIFLRRGRLRGVRRERWPRIFRGRVRAGPDPQIAAGEKAGHRVPCKVVHMTLLPHVHEFLKRSTTKNGHEEPEPGTVTGGQTSRQSHTAAQRNTAAGGLGSRYLPQLHHDGVDPGVPGPPLLPRLPTRSLYLHPPLLPAPPHSPPPWEACAQSMP